MTEEQYDAFTDLIWKNVQLLHAYRDTNAAIHGPYGSIKLQFTLESIKDPNRQLTHDELAWNIFSKDSHKKNDSMLASIGGGVIGFHVSINTVTIVVCTGDVARTGLVLPKPPTSDHYVCCSLYCGKPGGPYYYKDGMFQCPRCPLITYCSAKCQKADWVIHKPHCKK
jgi:hypothetical protein